MNEPIDVQRVASDILNCLAAKKTSEATENLVRLIKKIEVIYTIRNDDKPEMWIYVGGIYVPAGRCYVKEICRNILRDAYTQYLGNRVLLKLEADTFIEQPEFFRNENVNLIPLENGIYNLMTNQLEEYSPRYFFFNKLPIIYDPNADCPAIKQFFREILFPEDIDVLQELFGYLLYRNYKYEKAFMFLGSGRNGKGKTIELMKRFLGANNCANISLTNIENDNFALSELFNKLANLSADLSKTALKNTGNFKSLTGHDLVSAARKFLTRIHFVNHAKMIFAANELPQTSDITPAFFNRWILINFPHRFISKQEYDQSKNKSNLKIANSEIIETISSSSELSGLFNWALEGLDRLLKNNGFSYGKTTEQIKNEWLRKSSSINAFIYDHVEQKWDSFVPKTEFREMYSKYCSKHKVFFVNDIQIKQSLSEMMGSVDGKRNIDGTPYRGWLGINLKNLDSLNRIEQNSDKIALKRCDKTYQQCSGCKSKECDYRGDDGKLYCQNCSTDDNCFIINYGGFF